MSTVELTAATFQSTIDESASFSSTSGPRAAGRARMFARSTRRPAPTPTSSPRSHRGRAWALVAAASRRPHPMAFNGHLVFSQPATFPPCLEQVIEALVGAGQRGRPPKCEPR